MKNAVEEVERLRREVKKHKGSKEVCNGVGPRVVKGSDN